MITLLALAAMAQPAAAASQKNMALLEEYFNGLGEVVYFLPAPLGGPELGGAVIKEGTGKRLVIAQVIGRKECSELLTQTLPSDVNDKPFTFLLTGLHLLTYPTSEVRMPDGTVHSVGDLTITDLVDEEGPKVLYELKGVADLKFQAGGSLSTGNILWQPSRHFLNTGKALPVKYNYFRLMFDVETVTYDLFLHLRMLPDPAIDDAANLNNNAISHYRAGQVLEAVRLLEQSAVIAESHQSTILRNQAYINSEIDDLDAQGRLMPNKPTDNALTSFWEGDNSALLRLMDSRRAYGLSDTDYAILGLTLAHEGRWREVDGVSVELERRQVSWYADYLWCLVKVAHETGQPEIGNTYLKALGVVNGQHPGYMRGWSDLLSRNNDIAGAQRLLEGYIRSNSLSSINLLEPLTGLYDIYYRTANQQGMEWLEGLALREPLMNLQAFVLIHDYTDMSTAIVATIMEQHQGIPVPDDPLEGISYQPGSLIDD